MRIRDTNVSLPWGATGGLSASAGVDIGLALADKPPVAPIRPMVHGRSTRAGISLLEVLISIFVLVVGILGLAALIPIGRFEVQEAGKLDRGAALGNQAHRELRLRGMLDPSRWVIYRDSPDKEYVSYPAYVSNLPPSLSDQQKSQVIIGPFAIDPLMLAHRQTRDVVFGTSPGPSLATFPYNIQRDAAKCGLPSGVLPELPRLSLVDLMPNQYFNNRRVNPSGIANTDSQFEKDSALAEYIFHGQDDLSFFVPDDKDARPVQQYAIRDGGDFITQPANDRLAAMSAAEYSWLVTISPSQGSAYQWATQRYLPNGAQTYVVSVVVFHKRPFILSADPDSEDEPPSERTVAIEFTGSGVGGGSVHLECDDERYLRGLRPNQWILVMGQWNVQNTPPDIAPVPPPVIAKWYRIVAVDDGSEPDHRYVTLDGPDWITTPNALVSFGTGREGGPITAVGAIVDGVIAVYDKTMQLDLSGK